MADGAPEDRTAPVERRRRGARRSRGRRGRRLGRAPATCPARRRGRGACPGTEALPPPDEVDIGRRRFFRQLASDVFQATATVVGAANVLQQTSMQAASAILDPDAAFAGTTGTAGGHRADRLDRCPGRRCRRSAGPDRVPDRLPARRRVAHPRRPAAPPGRAPRDRVPDRRRRRLGDPRDGRPGRPGDRPVGGLRAVAHGHPGRGSQAVRPGRHDPGRRQRAPPRPTHGGQPGLGRGPDAGPASRSSTRRRRTGRSSPAALRAEADAICAEATRDHGLLAEHGLALLPRPLDRPRPGPDPLQHRARSPAASSGPPSGVVQAAVHAGREIHVHVDETRPYLQGARLTAWELEQAGVPYTLAPDAAAGAMLASGRIDAVLVGADRIAANGDTANKIGTYPLAVLAAHHGVPFYVCAPLNSVDLATADGSGIPIEERAAERGPGVRRDAGRAARGDRLEPGLRRHAGRPHLGHRHRGGRAPPARSGRPSNERSSDRRRADAGPEAAPRSPRPGPPTPVASASPGRRLMATVAIQGRRDAVEASDEHGSCPPALVPRAGPPLRRLRPVRPRRPRVRPDALGGGPPRTTSWWPSPSSTPGSRRSRSS